MSKGPTVTGNSLVQIVKEFSESAFRFTTKRRRKSKRLRYLNSLTLSRTRELSSKRGLKIYQIQE